MNQAAFSLLGIIFSTLIFLPIVRAEDVPQQGVTMTVYDGSPLGLTPWEIAPDLPICYSDVVPAIDFDWGGAPPAERKRAAATIIPAVIITQLAQAAVAAAATASTPSNNRKGKK